MEEKDAEIERLRSQLAIYKQQVLLLEDLQAQNDQLKSQLEAAYKTNETQMKLNETQAELVAGSTDQVKVVQQEKSKLASQVGELENLRSTHQKQMAESVKYMEELENRVYQSNQVGLKLLTQVRDLTEEVETLKVYILDLKKKIAFYVPIKDDAVDCRLADFVNNYPERHKLKIMFVRESQGIYEFGKKRIEVRVA